MRTPAVIALVVVAILIGFGIGYFLQTRQVSTLEAELSDIKSKMGVEIQTLQNEVQRLEAALEEAKRRLEEEEATRRILEESLERSRIWK